MFKKYREYIMYGILAFSVLVFFFVAFTGISKLTKKSNDLVNLKLQSKTADDQLTSLAAARKQLQKYSFFNDVAKTVIPNDKDQAQAVLDIYQMASASGIALQDITFPASTLGTHSSSAATGASTTGSGSTSPASSTSSSSAAPLSQAKAVSGIDGLYSLQLIITNQTGTTVSAAQTTTFPKFLDFLSRIERDRRTAQITQLSIEPQTNVPGLGFSLTLNIFIKPS